ncbi:hypothetical protein, partial [Plasmodium yoelii yoelii]
MYTYLLYAFEYNYSPACNLCVVPYPPP